MEKIKLLNKQLQIEKKILDLHDEKRLIDAKKNQLQLELTKLNERVRRNGGKLPQLEYNSICRRQNENKKDIAAYIEEIQKIKREISTLGFEKHSITVQLIIGADN